MPKAFWPQGLKPLLFYRLYVRAEALTPKEEMQGIFGTQHWLLEGELGGLGGDAFQNHEWSGCRDESCEAEARCGK